MINFSQKLRSILTGRRCEDFRFVEGGTLILRFRKIESEPASIEVRLWIDCTWRLRNEHQIIVGSFDDSQLILECLRLLPGRDTTEVEVDEVTKDVHLSFSELTIEVFCYSIEHEQWQLRCADGYRMGCGPNLEWRELYADSEQEEEQG